MLDCIFYLTSEILSICKIIVHVGYFIINFYDSLVIGYGIIDLTGIIASVCDTYKGLDFFWIVVQSLLKVLASVFGMA